MKIFVPADLTHSEEQIETFLNKNINSEFYEKNKIWTVISDEPIFQRVICDVVKSKLKTKGIFDKDIYFADGFFNWNECFQKYENLDLFADTTLVQIYLKNGKPGSSGGKFLSDLNLDSKNNLHLLLYLPKLDSGSKKSSWFRSLEQVGISIEFRNENAIGLANFIGNKLDFFHGRGKHELTELMMDKCEGNFSSAHNELCSLKLIYEAYGGTVNISSLVSMIDNKSRHNPFRLPEFMEMRDKRKILRVINELKEDNVPLPLLIWVLSNYARKKLDTKSEKILITLHELDKYIKGVSHGDPWREFERIVINY